jgi:release factor glutamine methyltransferase
MVRRREQGHPLEHILGWAEFCGLRMAVEPGVFVPRHRTEYLVRQAIALAPPGAVVLDLCCGSGALGAAMLAADRGIELHASDVDPAAVRCARRNLAGRAQVYLGDLYDPLPGHLQGRIQVMVANVPYVPTDAVPLMPPEARLHEATAALDGGADGLAVLRRVCAGAPAWLASGGHLLVETSDRQAASAIEAAAGHGLDARVAHSGEFEATVLIARLS